MTEKENASWLAIIAVFFVGCCATALVPTMVPILGRVAGEFGVERGTLGWLISLPSLACALGALAFGLVIDRLGDRTVLFAGVVIVVIGNFAVTQAASVDALLVARIVQGLGYIALTVAGATFVLRTTSGEHRRKAMALWAAHTPAGFAAAILFVTPLAVSDASWRWAFSGHAIFTAVFGIIAWLVVRGMQGGAYSRGTGIALVLSTPKAYRIGLASLGSAMLQTGLMTVITSHLTRSYGISPQEAAMFILAAMAANLAGAIVVVVTKIQTVASTALLTTAAVAAVAGAVVLLNVSPNITGAVVALVVFTGTLGVANALIWALLPSAISNPQASGAFGGFVTQTTFIGVLIGPPTFFALSSAMRPDYTIPVVVVLFVLIALAAPAIFDGKKKGANIIPQSAAH